MKHYHVAVVRGGPSSEYDVSLKTGRAVRDALREACLVRDIVIDKKGAWYVDGLEKTPAEALKNIDVVFNAMHGEYGEDGKFQTILQSMNIPFTGPYAFSASVAMNKARTKDIYKQHGIKTPLHKMVTRQDKIHEVALDIFRSFAMPVVLKPASLGSSVGVSIARDFESLESTLKSLFEYSDGILVEEYIKGKEATVGVIDKFRNEDHYAMLPIEIRPPAHKDFFDYECKYDGSTEELCPGNFSKKESGELQDLARKAHRALGMRHYSRTDFIIHPSRGIYALETNALPGLTEESLFPKGLEPIGATYEEFLRHVIELAKRDKGHGHR